MVLIFKSFITLLCIISLSHCGLGEVSNKKEKSKPQELPIGVIVSVISHNNFAIMRRYGGSFPKEGSVLISKGIQESNLKVSGEFLGEHVILDIRSGCPAVGDAVFWAFLSDKPSQKELKKEAKLH